MNGCTMGRSFCFTAGLDPLRNSVLRQRRGECDHGSICESDFRAINCLLIIVPVVEQKIHDCYDDRAEMIDYL